MNQTVVHAPLPHLFDIQWYNFMKNNNIGIYIAIIYKNTINEATSEDIVDSVVVFTNISLVTILLESQKVAAWAVQITNCITDHNINNTNKETIIVSIILKKLFQKAIQEAFTYEYIWINGINDNQACFSHNFLFIQYKPRDVDINIINDNIFNIIIII